MAPETRRPPRIHYLRGNKGERSPHRLLVFDTEAATIPGDEREVQVLRVWCARLINRHGRRPKEPRETDSVGETAEELVDCVESAARASETLWVFTHNLSYDLVLTRLPLHLLARGWQLGRHNLASEAPWALFRRGSLSIRLADSWSWLPVSVKVLGNALGMSKPDLPEDDADVSAWAVRCQADLDITSTAIVRLMDEWDARRLGWWSITGPATGWNSYLHMSAPPTAKQTGGSRQTVDERKVGERHRHPVITPDADARAFERQSLYSGRRDVWTRGRVKGGPFVDLDFRNAHLAVCAAFLLPCKRTVHFDSLELDDWHLRAQETSVIAECVVDAREPRYPLRWRNAVVHPVGRFKTILCGPELKDAAERGELVSVGAGYSYRLSKHMQPWAQWALGILRDEAGDVEPTLRVFLKGASRTVPGRWAMLTARDVNTGPSVLGGWSLEPMMFGTPAKRGALIHLGDTWVEQVRDQEAEDSFPAVLAFIQSHVRVLLNRAIDRLGGGEVLQCNTDSMLVRADRLAQLARESWLEGGPALVAGAEINAGVGLVSSAAAPLHCRIKTTAQSVVVRSPQHVRLDGVRKYAGVPGGAEEIAPETFRFWTWPKLAGQMERGDPRGYVRELRVLRLGDLPVNRWAFADGCCEPVRAAWSPETGTTLCKPGPGFSCRHGASLAPKQHQILRRLLG